MIIAKSINVSTNYANIIIILYYVEIWNDITRFTSIRTTNVTSSLSQELWNRLKKCVLNYVVERNSIRFVCQFTSQHFCNTKNISWSNNEWKKRIGHESHDMYFDSGGATFVMNTLVTTTTVITTKFFFALITAFLLFSLLCWIQFNINHKKKYFF